MFIKPEATIERGETITEYPGRAFWAHEDEIVQAKLSDEPLQNQRLSATECSDQTQHCITNCVLLQRRGTDRIAHPSSFDTGKSTIVNAICVRPTTGLASTYVNDPTLAVGTVILELTNDKLNERG